jgi:ADP-heptose:LPS heptosyltransferase
VRTDCRHYRTSQPCAPHKQTGARCQTCGAYDPVRERLLIVKLGAMGDVLRTTTCLGPLRARHPHAHVTWVTRVASLPLLAGNPLIDRVLSVDEPYLEFLLAEQFDLVIAPDADPLSASIAAIASGTAKAGFVADGRGGVRPTSPAAERWWRLGIDDALKQGARRTYGEWLYDICGVSGAVARPSLVIPDDVTRRVVARLRRQAPEVHRWIAFNTGGSDRWEQKRWNRAHYAPLARLIAAHDPALGILLVGGPDEASLNQGLLVAHPEFVDGGTPNTVAEFAALVSLCEWVLTGDSLGYHVACAVGTPACCLVGPTAPWELDAYGENLVLHADLDCIACYRASCPLSVTCMDALAPQHVWDRVLQWRMGAPTARAATPA